MGRKVLRDLPSLAPKSETLADPPYPFSRYYMAYYLLGGVLIFVGGMLLHFATLKRGDSYLLGVSVLVSIGCGICGQTASTP